ncbi:hypothetical protein BDD12DRAFT_631289, partial [Trichophaea hybrida]
MKILHNASTLFHNVNELVGTRLIPAYESPSRITSILSSLTTHYSIMTVPTNLPHALSAAAKVHTPAYLLHLENIFASALASGLVDPNGCLLPECFPVSRLPLPKKSRPPKDLCARIGYYAFDMSSGIAEGTWVSAIASADLARRGALALAAGEDDTVFALCRPPGHHCAPDLMGGYCYLNNTAIAVRTLLDVLSAGEQVSVLDLDFHHGNGTQQIFYRERNPCYVSIHGEDEYPYFSGSAGEEGDGDGEGYNLNLPIPCEDVDWEVYEPRLKEAVEKLKSVETRWLVVSLGFDTFMGDPVGKFQLETRDYGIMGEMVGECGWPVLVVLEGGYVIEELGRNCLEFLRG